MSKSSRQQAFNNRKLYRQQAYQLRLAANRRKVIQDNMRSILESYTRGEIDNEYLDEDYAVPRKKPRKFPTSYKNLIPSVNQLQKEEQIASIRLRQLIDTMDDQEVGDIMMEKRNSNLFSQIDSDMLDYYLTTRT